MYIHIVHIHTFTCLQFRISVWKSTGLLLVVWQQRNVIFDLRQWQLDFTVNNTTLQSTYVYAWVCFVYQNMPRMLQLNFNTTKCVRWIWNHQTTLEHPCLSVCGKILHTPDHTGKISPGFDMSIGKERMRHLPSTFPLFLFQTRLSSFPSSSPLLIWRTSRAGSWKCQGEIQH